MIVIKLQGGLGNQMFQYAVAKSLSKQSPVFLDFSFINAHQVSSETFTKRNFELDIFNINYKEFNHKHYAFFLGNSLFNKVYRFIRGKTFVIRQKENEWIDLPQVKNLYLDGYFQSEKYFKEIRETILNNFSFPTLDYKNSQLKKKIFNAENSVSLHVRRGDYLKETVKKYHGVLSDDYYDKAIEHIKNNLNNPIFFLFSDDIAYVSEKYNNMPNVHIIDSNLGKNSWKDMYLMSQCKHHIIANSSFSWWGTWLGKQDGINIAPKNWFNPEVAKFDIDIIIPSNWLKI